MALKIVFSDTSKTELEYLNALETEEFWNGSSRRTLTFEMARDAADIEALDRLCTEDNCASLTLVNEEESVTNIYEGYVLKIKVAVEPVIVQAESPESAAVYEDRILLKLGKRTYIEQELHDLGLD